MIEQMNEKDLIIKRNNKLISDLKRSQEKNGLKKLRNYAKGYLGDNYPIPNEISPNDNAQTAKKLNLCRKSS